MRKAHYNVYAATCPTRQALDRIADKWTALIIGLLTIRPHRFGELRRAIEGISQKMLTQTLRSLERDGMLTRSVTPAVPVRVDYELTPLGQSLSGVLGQLKSWAEEHMPEVDRARATYDAAA